MDGLNGIDANSTDNLFDFIWNSTNSTNTTNSTDEGGIILPPVWGEANRGIDESDDDDGRSLTALAVSVPLIAALLVGLLFYKKQRRTMTASEYNDMMASDFVIVGTGDHPDSFHEGLYHYTNKGGRYLSTRCEHCLETRRNTFYTDDMDRGLPTILEDEAYGSDQGFVGIVSPDSKDLGNRHLGIDVHKCTSATCTRCNHGETSVNFVRALNKEGDDSGLRNQEFAMTREEAIAYRGYGSEDYSDGSGSV